MYMDVHKEGTSLSFFFGGEERGNKLQRYLTNFLLGQHHPIGARVWMHVFCSYSCAVKRKSVPKATTCVFLGYAQSGYRCYDVKSKRLDVSLNVLFNEVASNFP